MAGMITNDSCMLLMYQLDGGWAGAGKQIMKKNYSFSFKVIVCIWSRIFVHFGHFI